MTQEIEKACAGAITQAAERVSNMGLTPMQTMALGASVLAFGLLFWLGNWYIVKLDERLARSTKLAEDMLDEHRRYSRQVVDALFNPTATVQFTFKAPEKLESQSASAPVYTKGGKA